MTGYTPSTSKPCCSCRLPQLPNLHGGQGCARTRHQLVVRRAKVESCWSPAWCHWAPSRSPAAPCRLDLARACSSTGTPRPALASQCFKGAPPPYPRPPEMELDGEWGGAWLSPHWLGAPSHPQFRSRVEGSLSRGQPLYKVSVKLGPGCPCGL